MAKAILDRQPLNCFFTQSLYKHILGKVVHYTDMVKEDSELTYLLKHNVSEMGTKMHFVLEYDESGVNKMDELVLNGQNVEVTEVNKQDYVKLKCQKQMSRIHAQLVAFLEGFYVLVPKKLIGIFTEHQLELLISGLPTIDVDHLSRSSEYVGYSADSPQIEWLWQAVRSFEQTLRAKFLQFVTGTSKVPLDGFSRERHLTVQRDHGSTDRLPCAHTW